MMRSRGNSTQMFFRLCWRAPIILIVSVDIGRNNGKQSPKHKTHEATSPDIPPNGNSPQRRNAACLVLELHRDQWDRIGCVPFVSTCFVGAQPWPRAKVRGGTQREGSNKARRSIRDALLSTSRHFSFVREVRVFGSRANGTARRSSGLDLAIFSPGSTPAEWPELYDALQNAPITYVLDIVRPEQVRQ